MARTELASPARPRRVLLVDDDALAAKVMGDAFAACGYEVVTAADGRVGLKTLTDQLFSLDLLVTDVQMAGFDGEDVVRTVRQLGGELDLPILVVTGSPQPELCDRLQALGADEVVAKSDGTEVIVTLADLLLSSSRRLG